jgi:hypothetical protein
MAGMDGVATVQAIRAMPAPAGLVRVVVVTADGFDPAGQRCLAAGANEVAAQPLDLDELRALLARHFGGHVGVSAGWLMPGPDPAAEGSQGLLDHDKLRSVRDLMGARQVPTLYGGFFVQAEEAARGMREALRAADPEALRRNARIVKVVAFKLGLPGLAAAATLLSGEAGTRTATGLALQRFEELTVATRALCARQGLLN